MDSMSSNSISSNGVMAIVAAAEAVHYASHSMHQGITGDCSSFFLSRTNPAL